MTCNVYMDDNYTSYNGNAFPIEVLLTPGEVYMTSRACHMKGNYSTDIGVYP